MICLETEIITHQHIRVKEMP